MGTLLYSCARATHSSQITFGDLLLLFYCCYHGDVNKDNQYSHYLSICGRVPTLHETLIFRPGIRTVRVLRGERRRHSVGHSTRCHWCHPSITRASRLTMHTESPTDRPITAGPIATGLVLSVRPSVRRPVTRNSRHIVVSAPRYASSSLHDPLSVLLSGGMLAWLSAMRCRLAYSPADATATHYLLLP